MSKGCLFWMLLNGVYLSPNILMVMNVDKNPLTSIRFHYYNGGYGLLMNWWGFRSSQNKNCDKVFECVSDNKLQELSDIVHELTKCIYQKICISCPVPCVNGVLVLIRLMLVTPTKIMKLQSPISQKLVKVFKRTSGMCVSTRKSRGRKSYHVSVNKTLHSHDWVRQ